MTRPLDEAGIEAAMDRLYACRFTPAYEQVRSELRKELQEMVPERLTLLLAVGGRRLQELRDPSRDVSRINHDLHLLFDFFEGRRLPQIRTFVERALQDEHFRMKARYVQTLEELGDPASVPPLVALLSSHRGSSIEDEDIRVAVLQALAGYFPPLADPSPVLDLLGDASLRVRSAVLQYLLAHPVDAAAGVLEARAQEEDDPDLLSDMLALLARADPARALVAAEERLASMPASETASIESLHLTIEQLRARPR